ncbi:MAG TPA: M20/M25/M40 family metallo-hydrolase [Gemmatimonadales bacterium]|nr:M20/M25/M40 family metallo-hydrolase [Gemmatimonadales bacterium]
MDWRLAMILALAAILAIQDSSRISEAQTVLSQLVESYGVSGMEAPVRATVQQLLPSWVRTETDTAGNLWVRTGGGQGDGGGGGGPVVIVAHMDEIGFRVDTINADGTLGLRNRGGFILSLFEAKPALIHTDRGDIPGIFLPRDTGLTRRIPPPLRVSVGATSRSGAESLGVKVGQTITMPKQYVRLAGTRATGRSFDDRMGCAALILALRRLDRTKLRHPVIFIFSVREEIGLEGAEAAAHQLGTSTRRVHAIDTFVSADSPLELPNFAVARIGAGAVARALDNSSITPPAYVDSLAQIARARGVALQIGTTNGGNDGSTFTQFGVVDVAMGWPLRYSHSPAEVVDLKDLLSLADLVRAVAEDW